MAVSSAGAESHERPGAGQREVGGDPPARPGVPAQGDEPTRNERVGPVEQVGPLAITRLRKDDGRALTLYRLAERDAHRAEEPS